MICLASMLPEYLSPPTSTLIHEQIGALSDAFCYDINVNCCGMLFSFYQIACQMTVERRLKHVLLIGSDTYSIHTGNSYPITPAIVGDATCTIILEQTECNSCIMDYRQFIKYDGGLKHMTFPICSSSNIYHASVEERKARLAACHVDTSIITDTISQILSENQLTQDNISFFCFSQYSLFTIKMPLQETIYSRGKISLLQ